MVPVGPKMVPGGTGTSHPALLLAPGGKLRQFPWLCAPGVNSSRKVKVGFLSSPVLELNLVVCMIGLVWVKSYL